MKIETLIRYTAISAIATALLLALGGLSTLGPDGGLGSPLAPALYYLGLVLIVPSYMGLYAAQAIELQRLGFIGFVLGILGAILYSAPVYVLFAGTSGVQTWHDVWFFAMGRGLLLPVGPTLFLVGSILFGIAIRRAGLLPAWSGVLLAAGSFLWLLAFWLSALSPLIGALLPLGNILSGVGLAWMARSLLAPDRNKVTLATTS